MREPTTSLSRRALFGAGLTRIARARFDAESTAVRGRPAPALPAWAAGDWDRQVHRGAGAAEDLLASIGAVSGARLLEVAGGDGVLEAAAAARGVAVTVAEAGRTRLPFGDEAFDHVASAFGIVHAADMRGAARELERVLRPGGRLGLLTWASAGAMGALLRVARGLRTVDRARSRPERWGSYEGLHLALGRFPGFELRELALTWRYDDREALWRELTEPPGPLAAPASLAPPRPLAAPSADALRDEVESRLEPFLADSGEALELRVDVCLATAARPA
jgi:SAM-dependent methyltransferase